jgi:trimeric autotransporter adhesin
MKRNLLFGLLILLGSSAWGQISLVKDINSGASAVGSNPNNLTVLGGFVYYSASDGVTGNELWRSDGTLLGTTQVKDINPGDNSSSPSRFTAIGSYIYFRADDGVHGTELWRTDGTSAGTVMVEDINPDNGASSPDQLTVVNSTTLYFSAIDGTNGRELWKTDVTTLATSMIKDINTDANTGSNPSYILLVTGTTVYFSATDGSTATGTELWKSDGTSLGTVRIKDIYVGTNGSFPSYLTLLGSTVFFSASDGTNGTELWSTNGTDAGTAMVSNISSGSGSSSPSGLTVMGSYVYFSANEPAVYGIELWRSNGTTTQIVSEMEAGTSGSFPSELVVVGSTLYFWAYSTASGYELYKTSGSVGAQTIININAAVGAGSDPNSLTNIGGILYFQANNGTNGPELWKYNGTTATQVEILAGANGSYATRFKLLGSTVFMAADNGSGSELWTIPTSGSTATQVVDLLTGTGSGNPNGFVYNGAGVSYFIADDGTGSEVWKTDGTTSGTTKVKDLNAAAGGSLPGSLTMVGTTLYFSAYDGTDFELYRSDGTSGGTVKLDINVGAGSSNPSNLFALNSTTLLFRATNGTSGTELFACVNGNSPFLVEDINSGAGSSSPSDFAVFGSFVYYQAYEPTNGYELWRLSTSTINAANNSLFANINPAAGHSSPNGFLSFGGFLYFSASDGTNGSELWRTDGTTTTLVKDINTTAGQSSYPYFLTAFGSNIYFQATDGTNGYELWKSDGTGVNTVLVKDIRNGTSSSSPSTFVPFNGKLFFTATTAAAGAELWSTDGTTGGTNVFKDINPGAPSGNFGYPVVIGTSLFFQASDGTGYSVFVTDGERTCATQLVTPFSGAQTAGATYFTAAGSKMLFSMVAQGYDRELFILDPALVTLPTNTAINTHPSTQTITTGSPVTFSVAAVGTNLTYQWQKNSVNISGATSASYNIPSVTGADAGQYRCVVTGTCGSLNSNQAILTAMAPEPTAQPTALVFSNPTNTSLDLAFTAATGAPAGYLVLRRPDAAVTDVPLDGLDYLVGNTIGSSIVAYVGSAVSFSNTTLAGSTNQHYAIFSFNGSSATANYLTTSPLIGNRTTLNVEPTSQPTALVFSSVTATSLTLSWTASDAARYIVVRKAGSATTDIPVDGTVYPDGSTNGTSVVVYTGTALTVNDSGLASGTVYHYTIFAFNGVTGANNYKTNSPLTGNTTTLVTVPTAQPTALQFLNRTTTAIEYSFTASGDAANYLVIRKLGAAPTEVPVNGTSYTAGASLGTATVVSSGPTTTGTSSGLTAQSNYFYSVFAFNGTGASASYLTTAPLQGDAFTLSAEPTSKPTALTFSSVLSESLTGSFTAATGSPAGYLVLRKPTSAPTGAPADGTTYATGATIGDGTVAYVGATTTFNDTGLTGEETFFYQVFPFNGTNTTVNYLTSAPLSNNQLMMAYEPGSQPTSLVISNITPTGYTVSFTAAEGFPDGYVVFRKNGSTVTTTPVDGTVYSAAQVVGDAVVAYVGTAVTFNETAALAPNHYAVFAYNGAGAAINYLATSPLRGNVIVDTTGPGITNETFTSIASGTSLKISATVSDPESAVTSVSVEYKSVSAGGAATTQPMVLTSGKWEYTVQASEIGELGVEFKITANNAQGLSSNFSGKTTLTVTTQNLTFNSFGSTIDKYRIISVPLVLTSKTVNDIFGDDLGSYGDKAKWRMYRYENTGTPATTSTKELNGSSNIELGKGYWLIVKEQVTIDAGPGTTYAASSTEPFTYPLVSGWNQIGNPYTFNILWSDVLTASGVSYKLKTYTGQGAGYNSDTPVLKAFEGGFVMASAAGSLKFPVTKNSAAGRTNEGKKNQNTNSIDSPEWEIILSLKNGDAIHDFGGIGMSPDAHTAYDDFDDFTLPRFINYLELNHQRNFLNIPYTKDVVPTNENHTWEFSVETNLGDETEMTWDNSYFRSSTKSIFLYDVDGKNVVDMKQINRYAFGASGHRSFKLVYGDENFVKETFGAEQLRINTIYPVPSNSKITIGFTIPQSRSTGNVNVKVLNTLGQVVNVIYEGELNHGYHEMEWSGHDSAGTRVAQGVFIVSVASGNYVDTRQIVMK